MINSAKASNNTNASKSEQAHTWLRQGIAARRFGPGARLVLADIAKELDMSVVPVREALRRLEAEGVVTFERNVGARVAIADEAEYVNTMQALAALEGLATALAAPTLTEEHLGRAGRINQQLRLLLDAFDARLFTEFNHSFHKALYETCPNPQVIEFVQRGWAQLSGIRESTFAIVPKRAAESVREHDEIITMIRDHAEPIDIELAVRKHRWRTVDRYLKSHGHPSKAQT